MLVALCVPALAADAAPSPSGGGGGTPAPTPAGPGGGAGTSPQTGYSPVLWGLCTVAMIGCAGICLVNSRKKAEE